MYYTAIQRERETSKSSQLIDQLQSSQRFRWKEMSQHELFQDHYTKYLCFNQIREGVILFEQGYENKPTFINQAAKQMFSIQEDTPLSLVLCNYTKIEKIEPRNSLHSIDGAGAAFDKQNSLFKYPSGSISQNSKAVSLFQRANSCKEVTFAQALEKIWNRSKKEQHLFYIQSNKPSNQSQPQPTFEISVYLNSQVRKIMTIICRDSSYKAYIKQLEAHNNQKSKMISFVSHEFRAPLGCMINMLEHVSQTQNNSYIQTSIDNSKYLLNLCNDLLDLAQMQANKFQLKAEKFNLKKLCQECLQMFSLQAEKKSLNLNLHYASNCPKKIESDPSRIKQIIINLIGNAFKFTEQGSISIIVEIDSDQSIHITISDTGLGVQEQDKKQLMKAFGKVNSEESRKLNSQGVGLGLLISNKIAQQLGDGLTLESTYRKGSKFSFTINPREQLDCEQIFGNNTFLVRDSEENVDEEESSKEIKITITQPKKSIVLDKDCCSKVLIVDDTHFNIEALQMMLDKIGVSQVESSINGYQALEKIKARKKCSQCNNDVYKLIFMDLEMPGINGVSTTKLILDYCEERKLQQLPIIVACSGHPQEQEFPKCQQVGMKFYLEKPVQLKYLLPIIQYFRKF